MKMCPIDKRIINYKNIYWLVLVYEGCQGIYQTPLVHH